MGKLKTYSTPSHNTRYLDIKIVRSKNHNTLEMLEIKKSRDQTIKNGANEKDCESISVGLTAKITVLTKIRKICST